VGHAPKTSCDEQANKISVANATWEWKSGSDRRRTLASHHRTGKRGHDLAVQIPVDVEEVTAPWLSHALERHDIVVERIDVLDAHSGTTGRVRVGIQAAPGHNPNPPASVFVKLAPFVEEQRAFILHSGIGAMEARLYAELGDELPVRIPRVWHAEVDDDGRYVMVLEDLELAGATFPRPRDPDIADRARATVDGLAALHARYWETDRFAGDLAWIPERAGFGAGDGKDERSVRGAGSFVRRALKDFGEQQSPTFQAVGKLYAEQTGAMLDWWDEGPRTLIHGDPHMGNLFADGPTIGFLDWAMVSRSPGARDLAYFCCNSIPTDVRRAIEPELLDRYRAGLAAGGITLDAATLFEQYRLFSVFSWVSTVSTVAVGGRWQPESRAAAAMERTTNALEDLDAAGLLAERLGA
jgi:aminoglycoside phosphotransferase (APT) family kinase protein